VGIFGALFQFDLTRYRDVVVPAFRAGEDHPVVVSAARALTAAGWPDPVTGGGLTEALDYVGEVRRMWPCFRDELTRAGWDFEMISLLYLWVVLRETVDAYAEVSSRHPTRLFDPPSPRAGELIELLSTPPDDELWMPGLDGVEITGWLDAAQTAELLSLLPPPDTEPDPVQRLCRQQALLLLKRAADHGQGVLWGTETTISIERHARHMFADRTPPIAYGPFPRPGFPQFFDPVTWNPIPPDTKPG
jgi:hypothetical protein